MARPNRLPPIHALVAFVFNMVILALRVNVVAGRL